MKTDTLIDSFLRTKQETILDMVEFFYFLFDVAEDFTFQLYSGKEL
jgi:hypothetical protein